MEFTELADYSLSAGHVTEWIPTTDDDGTCWAVDDRPLTYEHESHFNRGSENSPENDWLGAIFEIHHPYDEGAIRRTLVAWMRRHEAFRTTVRKDCTDGGAPESPLLLRLTNSGDALDVRPREVGHLRTGTRVHQHLADLFDNQISPLRWPHCLAATISGGPDSPGQDHFHLVFGADHSVMDAYSMLLAIREIQMLYAAELYGVDPGLSAIGSHVDFSVADRLMGGGLRVDDHVVTTWRRFLDSENGNFPAFCLPVIPNARMTPDFSESPGTLQNGSSSWVLSTAEADAIGAYCRRMGSGMQSAVIAAVALAAREVAAQDTLRFAMPMHTRYELQYAESVGWYVGIIPVEVDITGLQTFPECVAAADRAVSDTKELSRYPFPRVAQLLGSDAPPRFVISYLDVRFVPGAQDWERWRARTLRSTAYSDDEVYMWIARTPVGMTLSARFPGNSVATTNVARFIDALATILGDVARASAATTADPNGNRQAIPIPQSSFAAFGTRDKFPA